MAEKKQSYPTIPAKHWWTLRNKFKQTIPSAVTQGYVATALSMAEASARANVLPALISFGIIDQSGKPQDRAVKWRDDEHYQEVCFEIRQELYPQELIDALPGPITDTSAVNRWFMTKTGVGEQAARKMAAVYILLTEADPAKANEDISKGVSQTRTQKTKPKAAKTNNKTISTATSTEGKVETITGKSMTSINPEFSPSVHIDVQIHISPDASVEQIDHIFASMAKHLFKRIDPYAK